MITSSSNPKIKRLRRLQSDRRFRRREGAYVIEGTRWLVELIQAEIKPNLVLVTGAWLQAEDNDALLEALPPSPIQQVSDQVMASVSDMESPAGILAEVPVTPIPLPAEHSLLLVLDRLANPGNLGAILRTATAAGVDGVLLAPGCVDLYNPKVVRAGMGAHLRLPIQVAGWSQISQLLAGSALWLSVVEGGVIYHEINWLKPSAVLIGGEAAGASSEARRLSGNLVNIPMHRKTESLNAAVAAGIILFEAARQRTAGQ